jgi:hypothetical protein
VRVRVGMNGEGRLFKRADVRGGIITLGKSVAGKRTCEIRVKVG